MGRKVNNWESIKARKSRLRVVSVTLLLSARGICNALLVMLAINNFKTWLVFLLAVLAAGCFYERRTTAEYPIQNWPDSPKAQQPKNLWSVTIISAQAPPRRVSGLNWDSDGTAPDPFVRILVDDRLVWQSSTVPDTLQPEFNATLPRDVFIQPSSRLRLELWDEDKLGSNELISSVQRQGLSSKLLAGDPEQIFTSTGAIITMKVSRPRAFEGLGIPSFEVRRDCLVVLEVEDYSPASRAGIHAGDRIVAIDGHDVEALGDAQATGMLSLAIKRNYPLDIVDDKGNKRQIKLDSGYIWRTM